MTVALLSRLRSRAALAATTPADLKVRLQAAEDLLRPAALDHRAAYSTGAIPRFADSPLASASSGLDDPSLRAAALWAHRTLCSTRYVHDEWPAVDLVTALARRRLAWRPDEVRWALNLALGSRGTDWDLPVRLRLPLSAAERLAHHDVASLEDLLRTALTRVGQLTEISPADRQRMVRRLESLLTDPERAVELPPSLLHAGDPFGPAVRDALGPRLTAPGVAALFVHAASASSPNPSKAWLAEGARLLQVADGGAAVVRDVLERAVAHRDTLQRVTWTDSDVHVWIHASTASLLRGLVLLAGRLDQPWVTPLLGDLALHAGGGNGGRPSEPRDLVVANAAIAALGERRDAVPHLARAQARLKHRGILKGVTKALETAARQAGLSRRELLETAVPTHGLDRAGTREEQLGQHIAVIRIAGPATVSLAFRDGAGKQLTGVPTAVKEGHAERLAELRAEVKEIKKTLATERLRVEGLLAEDRTWAFDDWARLYRDHPLLGRLVRGLLWQLGEGDAWHTGRLRDDGELVALDGSPLDDGAQVRLWHPALVAVEEVRAWRSAMLDADLRQPFKQAFREVYLLTPAEVETGEYSNRFAAHVLRAPQAQALMRTRGWGGTSLGYYDGGFEGHVTREFGDVWRAEFLFDLIESADDGYGTPSLAGSDQVRFSRREGRNWSLRPLTEVPPLVFTEAMRDVDLFVGVTSIAADPAWINRGDRQHDTYWHRTSFGDLNESARTRREALERLVPRLRIADRLALTDRFLEVRGSLRTYRIHLGSGNILMTPNDEYLCIVAARGEKSPTVYLPFEESGLLSEILSKAFLLADDTAITDRSITSQINGR